MDLKFVTDGMLGRFSRWLRLLGYDVKYFKDKADDVLLRIAEEEKRVLLTKDAELFRKAQSKSMKTLFIKGINKVEQLAYFAKSFGIRLEADIAVSCCPICGSLLRSVDRRAVSNKVPSGTLKHYTKFWLCDKCDKVYWLGRHWKKINEILEKAKALTERVE